MLFIFQIHHNPHIGATVCQGVIIQGLKATLAPRRPTQDRPVLQSYQFVPLQLPVDHPVSAKVMDESSVGLLVDLVIENLGTRAVKVVENGSTSPAIGLGIMSAVDTHAQLKVCWFMKMRHGAFITCYYSFIYLHWYWRLYWLL